MTQPIAFVVMPFGVRPTGRADAGAPAAVDFDRLWARVYEPLLTAIGYRAVRADRDIGALIIAEMIQRLALADLVVADITLPNANVYYEIGVRHAARRRGCVLVAADWAKPVFDLAQIRHVRFPLRDGAVGEPAAAVALAALEAEVERVRTGVSPVFAAVPGFPDAPEHDRLAAFENEVAELASFDADVRAVRIAPPGQRRGKVQALLDRYGEQPVIREAVVLELLRLVRDHLGWQPVLEYIAALPTEFAEHPLVREQQALAIGEAGDLAAAAAQLEQLIDSLGATPERFGLLGGRFKRLAATAAGPGERRRQLDRAIDAYRRGMELDLNAYYCASNLPVLYRERGEAGDEQLADEAERATALACKVALANGTADRWARPTLLALAFHRGDVAEAIRLRREVEREGPLRWELESTLTNIRASIASTADEGVRAQLQAVLDQLTELPVG